MRARRSSFSLIGGPRIIKRRTLNPSQRAVAAALAWRQAEAEGRVLTGRGGDRTKAQDALCIKDPRSYFAKQFEGGEKAVALDERAIERIQLGPDDLQAPEPQGSPRAAFRRLGLPDLPPMASAGVLSDL